MRKKERHWFWNLVLALTVIICVAALVAHYKNWISLKQQEMRIVSGFYVVDLPFVELDSVEWVERLPPMERLNGFSALQKEKGIFREFKDSLIDKKVYVFVDNIDQQKIRLVYKDTHQLYINLKDSLATVALFKKLSIKNARGEAPN